MSTLEIVLTLALVVSLVTLAIVRERGKNQASALRGKLAAAKKDHRTAQELADSRLPKPRIRTWRQYIRDYEFPAQMLDRALERCPASTDKTLVEAGLRQFLIACGTSPQLKAAMPSKTVDEAWHEFITYTRDYADFCQKAYGKFLNHVPEVTMSESELTRNHTSAMETAWEAACEEEGLNPTETTVEPALFASDAKAGLHAHPHIAACDTLETCSVPDGTVCVNHAYRARPIRAAKHQPAPKPAKAPVKAKPTRTSSSRPTGSRSSDTGSADVSAALFAASAFSSTADHSVADTAPASTPAPTSSCGSTTSTSSCSSSSCGGGGCGS